MIHDLQEYLTLLKREGQLHEISVPVDPYLEAAEIHRRVVAAEGPALLFTHIKGAAFPLATNLFGSTKRIDLAFGSKPEQLVQRLAHLPERLLPPSLERIWEQRSLLWLCLKLGTRSMRKPPVFQVRDQPPALQRLPLLTTWKEDGGPFVTLPLVYTEHPQSKIPNLGMYRLQRFDDNSTGFHCQIGKGAGFHLSEARRLGQKLPVTVAIGGPPALVIAAAAPLPENVPELLLASLLMGDKVPLAKSLDSPLPLLASAEFVLVGEVDPNEHRPEGPFGDHYGYYSLQHDYPVFRCRSLYRRERPVCTATVVGKGRQEDCFLGDYIQSLLSPIFPVLIPSIVDFWAFSETGYHSLAAAVVKQQRYKREALASAFRILGEGQLSLTKVLLVVEQRQDLKNFKALLEHVLERSDFQSDLYVVAHTSMDTLDYTSTRVNEGSKAIWLGLGEPKRSLPESFSGQVPQGVKVVQTFCRGCLVIEGPSYREQPGFGQEIAHHPVFKLWPLIVLSDDAKATASSSSDFLWHTFTRFEPASDIKSAAQRIEKNHVAFTPPVLIDARMKPGYPDELFCDDDTRALVDRRWRQYFPNT